MSPSTRPPLAGMTVMVTRPAHQAASLADPLAEFGAKVILLPAIAIAPPEDAAPLDDALRNLDRYDWVALTSANGVEAVRARLAALGIPIEALTSRRLAAVGPATAEAMGESFRAPDLVPDAAYLSEGLAEAFDGAFGDVRGQRVLLPRADLARRVLGERLREAGATVDEVDAYRIVSVDADAPLPEREPDAILFASGSAVRATRDALAARGRAHWLSGAKIGCLGPIVAATVEELGFTVAFVAEESTVPGLMRALIRTWKEEVALA